MESSSDSDPWSSSEPDFPDDRFKYALTSSLLQKLCREEPKNFVFSPLGLAACLGMAAIGLKGESKTELMELVRAPSEDSLHSAFRDRFEFRKCPLKVANKILAEERCVLREEAKSALERSYKCKVDIVDFARDAPRIQSEVNAWIARQTENKITEILTGNDLKPEAILMIVNAVYFKGMWVHPFESLWRPRWFTLRDGRRVLREFMSVRSLFPYTETDKLRLAKLYFEPFMRIQRVFFMVVAIPRNVEESIDRVLAGMTTSEIMETMKTIEKISNSASKRLLVRIPKLKIEYKHANLERHLEQLGLSRIFTQGQCDFGNLFSKVKDDPFVSGIIHKAVIEVNEENTEAAASAFAGGRVWRTPPPPVEMILERPFCFWIVSERSIPCLAGICADP